MPRIVGVDIPKDKQIEIALTYIHGIGRFASRKILKTAGIDFDVKAKDIDEAQVSRITSVIQRDNKVEGELKNSVNQDIRRLMDIGSYRGSRHKKSLPVHGQRTKTNARTCKGPKKSGIVRRKVVKK